MPNPGSDVRATQTTRDKTPNTMIYSLATVINLCIFLVEDILGKPTKMEGPATVGTIDANKAISLTTLPPSLVSRKVQEN